MSKVIWDCIGFALPCSVSGLENSRHLLSQSDTKLKPIATWLLRFPALNAKYAFTSISHWLSLIFPLFWLVLRHSIEKPSIFYSHSDSNRLQSVRNDELRNFDVWLKCKKLSVNLKKNNYIIFESRQKKLNYHLTVFYGNQSLNQANMTKFLGVYVDEHLTWKHHISISLSQWVSYPSLDFTCLQKQN